jgi:outer membrane protein assembly factor BamE (lipoprotein component of BamABCDE complex)
MLGIYLKIIVAFLLLVSFSYCTTNEQKWVNPCKSVYDKSKELKLPYFASSQRKAEIIKAFPKLETGMSREQVVAILGEPDYSSEAHKKEYAELSEKSFIYTDWDYYLERPESEDDAHPFHFLGIYFGKDCKVFEINAESIVELGKVIRR